VIVVRYFGGTKLGPGGLVRAYSDSVNKVIAEAELVEYEELHAITIEFAHAITRRVNYECEQENIAIVERQFDTQARYTLEATQEKLQHFLEKMQRDITIV
jgi:putative IMPACT (imprinted ancient) family translation regulator